MSALATAATTTKNPIHGRPCSVAVALDTLDPASRRDLQAWLDGTTPGLGKSSPPLSDSRIYEAITALGVTVGAQTIGRHRRYVRGLPGQKCRCAQ